MPKNKNCPKCGTLIWSSAKHCLSCRETCPTIDRFNRKTKLGENGCWEWTGHKVNGYGRFHEKGGNIYAHVYSWRYFKGDIENGKQVDHICRNRSCVNPYHLDLVTPKENQRRSSASRAYCKNWHLKLSNVYFDKKGHGICRACRNLYQKASRAGEDFKKMREAL